MNDRRLPFGPEETPFTKEELELLRKAGFSPDSHVEDDPLFELRVLKAQVDLEREIASTGKRMYGRDLTEAECVAAFQKIQVAPLLTVEEAIKLALLDMPGGRGN